MRRPTMRPRPHNGLCLLLMICFVDLRDHTRQMNQQANIVDYEFEFPYSGITKLAHSKYIRPHAVHPPKLEGWYTKSPAS